MQAMSPNSIITTEIDIMTNTNMQTTDNLTKPLQSAVPVALAGVDSKNLSAGNRYARIIAKGKSKLGQSLAVEIPAINSLAGYATNPSIASYLINCLESVQESMIRKQLEDGVATIQYSSLTVEKMAEFLTASESAGRLSADKIGAWFDSNSDIYMVALADRLGISDAEATEADVKRLQQVANMTKGNLQKLAAKTPVHFDERIKNALEWALAVMPDDDVMVSRLQDKLANKAEETANLADMLGM